MFLAFFAELAAQFATAIAMFLAAITALSPLFVLVFLADSGQSWSVATARRERFDANGYSVDELAAWDEWKGTEQIERARFRAMLTWSDLGKPIGEPLAATNEPRALDQASVAHALGELLAQARETFPNNERAQLVYAHHLQSFFSRHTSDAQTTKHDTSTHTAITVASARE